MPDKEFKLDKKIIERETVFNPTIPDGIIRVEDIAEFLRLITEEEVWEYCPVCKSFECNADFHKKIKLQTLTRIKSLAGPKFQDASQNHNPEDNKRDCLVHKDNEPINSGNHTRKEQETNLKEDDMQVRWQHPDTVEDLGQKTAPSEARCKNPITKKEYKKPATYWMGKKVRLLRDVKSKINYLKKGEIVTITGKRKGFAIQADYKNKIGYTIGIKEVPYNYLEKFQPAEDNLYKKNIQEIYRSDEAEEKRREE